MSLLSRNLAFRLFKRKLFLDHGMPLTLTVDSWDELYDDSNSSMFINSTRSCTEPVGVDYVLMGFVEYC